MNQQPLLPRPVEADQLPRPSLSTALLHNDDVNHQLHPNHPVAPNLSTSTTFRYPHPDSVEGVQFHNEIHGNAELDMQSPSVHVYSRLSQETHLRTEKVLSGLLDGHALTYSSGLAAAYAAIVHYSPSVIAIRKGYHGCHSSIQVYARNRSVRIIDLDDDYPIIPSSSSPNEERTESGGLLVWLETPLNPTGEARDLSHYVAKTHAVQGIVLVDATFAPPPLQYPFHFNVDMILHSATKYLGGHSDLLAGVLVTRNKPVWNQLWHDRSFLGSILGNLESYLLLRSLRTFTVRITKQSQTAAQLVEWIHSLTILDNEESVSTKIGNRTLIHRCFHSSLQPRPIDDVDDSPFDSETYHHSTFNPCSLQMVAGGSPTFAFRMTKPIYAKYLPHLTNYFTPATSLGGVESLLEHRIQSDRFSDPRLIRLSTGLEEFHDLKADLESALLRLVELEQKGSLVP